MVFSTVSTSLGGGEAEGEIADGAMLEAQIFGGERVANKDFVLHLR